MITLALRRFAIPPRCFRAASARNAPWSMAAFGGKADIANQDRRVR